MSHERHEGAAFLGYDYLRGLAAFGIIGCHLNLGAVTRPAATMLSFCDLNVGLFSTLAGFFMCHSLSKRDASVPQSLKSRLCRLLPVYLLWTAIYVVCDVVLDRVRRVPVNVDMMSIPHWLRVLFEGGASCHLWFIACLLYVQVLLCFPVAWLTKRASPFASLLVLLVGCLGVYGDAALASQTRFSSTQGWFAYYFLRLLAFFVVGVGFYGVSERIKKATGICLAVLLISGLICHRVLPVFPFVRDLLVVLPVMAVGLHIRGKSDRSFRIGRGLRSTSLGVYLVHPLFAAAGCGLLRHVCEPPYGIVTVLLYWISIWLFSMAVVGLGARHHLSKGMFG